MVDVVEYQNYIQTPDGQKQLEESKWWVRQNG